MAEQANSTALIPVEGQYQLEAKEFDAAGKATLLKVTVPDTGDFSKWSLMQRAVMLKKGPWQASSVYEILFGILYAENLGLDVMRGDVFPTGNGRLGIANKAKIKMALDTGNVAGIQVSFRDTGSLISVAGLTAKTDLECTATIHVRGWKVPIVKKGLLSKWFKAKNPNWVGNFEHMLELNTVAHACEYVPGAACVTGDDEQPPPFALDTPKLVFYDGNVGQATTNPKEKQNEQES